MSEYLSRRSVLAATGGLAAALTLPGVFQRSRANAISNPVTQVPSASTELMFAQPRPARLPLWGRITEFGTPVRSAPGGDVSGFLPMHTVLPIFEIVHAPGPSNNPNNDTWYRVEGGFLYTAGVQIIQPYHMPEELSVIDTLIDEEPGFWAEVVVPYTTARVEPGGGTALTDDGAAIELIYSSVHRVIESEADAAGFYWYRIDDDKRGAPSFYALARHMRRIAPEELAPINSGANKRISVSLADQRIDCFEDDQLIFSTLCSSGGGFATPTGDWAVVYKQPSRHMYSDPENEAFSDPDFFDLPGVPFNIFFTTFGHAIHGTYWHGDYGRPRSHGCLNVTPEAARWIFRWVDPVSPYESSAVGSSAEPGTPVIVR